MARPVVQKLKIADVEYIAFKLAKKFMEWNESIPSFDSRFPEKLESCIETPFQTFDRKSLYKGVVGKASIQFYLMVKNHPFQNGNKRIAVTTLLYFLYINGTWLSINNEDLYKFARNVADSDPRLKSQTIKLIQNFIKSNLSKQIY